MSDRRWLVTGAAGQVGSRIVRLLEASGDVVAGLTHASLDVTSAAAVDDAVATHRPDVVLNLAAYTAVDAAESDVDGAAAVNVDAPRLLARTLARRGGRLVHVSTDYVFAGDADRPYEPDDPTGPRTVYGRTKLAGEQAVRAELPDAHHIVRTAWVHGGPGANFVDTMIKLESAHETITVVDDQVGSPTWAQDLAAALVSLGRSGAAPGTLHFANAGTASWWELARATFAAIGADPERVRPVGSAEFVRPAPRPAWSVLSLASWTGAGLPAPRPWQEALAASIDERRAGGG